MQSSQLCACCCSQLPLALVAATSRSQCCSESSCDSWGIFHSSESSVSAGGQGGKEGELPHTQAQMRQHRCFCALSASLRLAASAIKVPRCVQEYGPLQSVDNARIEEEKAVPLRMFEIAIVAVQVP